MTDKQIIIDGIDVSGCEFRFRTYGCDCMSSNRETKVLTESSRCADNPNCYYKQLKRKEQECETLASQLDFEVQKKECLEQECEEYSKELARFQQEVVPKLRKRLRNKEQECEKLNEELYYWVNGEYCDNKCNVVKELDQLKADLEQEKALKETYFACYKAKHEDIEGKLFKLSNTIAEIKEIAESQIKAEENNKYKTNGYIVALDILQKISECEGNND